jgi:hypothetical protein
MPEKAQSYSSDDYVESLQAVTSDPFDSSSWKILLDEIEAGRGATGDFTESMSKFLSYFPRAGREWIRFAEYYEVKAKDLARAEEVLRGPAAKLRSVAVWIKYIDIVKKLATEQHGSSDGSSISTEAQGAIRNAVGAAYEKAADNVGLAIDSGTLWRGYIEFVDSWPDASGMDPGKKLAAARNVYHSSLIVPMDELDHMYEKYEHLEKSEGDHNAREVLPEWEKRYLSSKALLNDRKAITNRISFNRLATPPTKSLVEASQINAWNKWIRYEFSNPSNLDAGELVKMMQMVFEMCLCSFRHHAEVWLGYANFLKRDNASASDGGDDGSSNHAKACAVLGEAIETIPNTAMLRFALSELEEAEGNTDNARLTLKQAYEQQPSGLTFSVLQRFVRRHDGYTAARKLFSETQHLRQEKRVGFDIYMANAQLELEGNCAPEITVKVLALCRAAYPSDSASLAFNRLLVRALVRLNDLRQIQWEFNSLLARVTEGKGKGGLFSLGDTALPSVATSAEELSKDATKTTQSSSSSSSSSSSLLLSLSDQLELWGDYLAVETTIGLSSIKRLNELRQCRDLARKALREHRLKESLSNASGSNSSSNNGNNEDFRGFFEYVPLLGERYASFVNSIPAADSELQKRCSATRGRGVGANGNNAAGMGSSDDLPLPPTLQSFLNRLPTHAGPEPDIDQYIRRFKLLVLPPRPSADGGGDSDLLLVGGSNKRAAPAEWLGRGGGATGGAAGDEGGDGIDYEMEDTYTSRDDVFRQRQRARFN